jgi:hypothetical protein
VNDQFVRQSASPNGLRRLYVPRHDVIGPIGSNSPGILRILMIRTLII